MQIDYKSMSHLCYKYSKQIKPQKLIFVTEIHILDVVGVLHQSVNV